MADPEPSLGHIIILLVTIYFAVMIYGFYRVLEGFTLRRLKRWMRSYEA